MDLDNLVVTTCKYIKDFYAGTDVVTTEKWLSEFSHSVEAWTVCDRILALHGQIEPVCLCFASQTLRQKILKSLHEIPANSYLSLRESLIAHMRNINAGDDSLTESTLTQLCLAIADLYIQVPEWTNWIMQLLNMFSSGGYRMMLTLLRVIPEESMSVRVGENRRRVIKEELAASATDVMAFLDHVLQCSQSDIDIVKKVMLCVSAYLGNPALLTDQLATGPLMIATFQILSNPSVPLELHNAATECVVAAALLAENLNTHLKLAKTVQAGVYGLVNAYNTCIAAEDTDKLQNYARLFVELNETLLEKIINEPSNSPTDLGSLHSLELILLLADYHDYSIVERSFNFWYQFSEGLLVIDDDSHLAIFAPYINRYLIALFKRCRFDTDESEVPDENSDFANFRFKVSETVKDVVFIVSTNACVKMMYDILLRCSTTNAPWDEMEAALFMISSVIYNIVPEDDTVVPEIVTAVSAIPSSAHPALILTGINMLGTCDEWLEKHSALHEKVLSWLFTMLMDVRFASAAADSIFKIVQKSCLFLDRLYSPLVQSVEELQKQTTKGKQIESAVIFLLRAASQLVMNMPPADMQSKLEVLLNPVVEKLKFLAAETNAVDGGVQNVVCDSWERLALDPMLWIDRISAIYKQLIPWQIQPGSVEPIPAPWLGISTRLFEVLSVCLSKHESKTRMVEHICRSLRYIIRSLGHQSIGFLEPLIKQMLEIYPKYYHSCFLYLSSILVDEYGMIQQMQPVFLSMLEQLSNATFAMFLNTGDAVKAMKYHPDTVDDLFRLAGRFVDRAMSAFWSHPVSKTIMECAITCLQIDHQEANRSVTRFLAEVFSKITKAKQIGVEGLPQITDQLDALGEQLVDAALQSALFHVTRSLRRDMAGIISDLGIYDLQKQRVWLQAAVKKLPAGRLAATDAQLQQFVDNLTTNQNSLSGREVFSEICELAKLYN